MTVLRLALPALGIVAVLGSYPIAAPKFSEWSTPQNLGPIINSPANDATPALSKSGSSLYFGSNRTGNGSVGANDIWVSQWDNGLDGWGVPVNLGSVINTIGIEASPALSRDEHWLFFHSNRSGNMDIWVSYREQTHDDLGWQPPVKLGAGVNSSFEESMGGFFENDDTGIPQIYFGSNRPRPAGPGTAFDLYVSDALPDGTFGAARLILELSSMAADPGMMVSADGLEAFLYSTRPDSGAVGAADLWTATRQTVFDLWSAPRNLGAALNTAGTDQRPYLSSDRGTLLFASDRPDVTRSGGLDLYFTTRSRR
jgi:hypothetical protein